MFKGLPGSDDYLFIQALINEFNGVYQTDRIYVKKETEAVVFLSAQEFVGDDPSNLDYGIYFNYENKCRLVTAIQGVRMVTELKSGINIAQITSKDIITHGTKLILSGTTEQLPFMMQMAKDLDFPVEAMIPIDCGKKGVGNTKTQFVTVQQYYTSKMDKLPKHLTFVSTAYHVPRVARTGNANLMTSISFDVIPVPCSMLSGDYPFNIANQFISEAGKIIEYSNRGDITRDLRI